ASVTTASTGPGKAGNITLTSGNDLLLSDSNITSRAQAEQASGGGIKLTAPNMVHLINGQLVASVEGSVSTKGGNINIDPQFVIIENSQILATATLGNGGNITITGNVVLIDLFRSE